MLPLASNASTAAASAADAAPATCTVCVAGSCSRCCFCCQCCCRCMHARLGGVASGRAAAVGPMLIPVTRAQPCGCRRVTVKALGRMIDHAPIRATAATGLVDSNQRQTMLLLLLLWLTVAVVAAAAASAGAICLSCMLGESLCRGCWSCRFMQAEWVKRHGAHQQLSNAATAAAALPPLVHEARDNIIWPCHHATGSQHPCCCRLLLAGERSQPAHRALGCNSCHLQQTSPPASPCLTAQCRQPARPLPLQQHGYTLYQRR